MQTGHKMQTEDIFSLLEADEADCLRDLLLTNNIEVDAKFANGRTLLHSACFHKKKKVVTMLLELGADINAGNHNGTTPLMYAKTGLDPGEYHFLGYLIRSGAEILRTDIYGKTIIDYLSAQKNFELITYLKQYEQKD